MSEKKGRERNEARGNWGEGKTGRYVAFPLPPSFSHLPPRFARRVSFRLIPTRRLVHRLGDSLRNRLLCIYSVTATQACPRNFTL